ncbi:MAG: hypothetical protein IJ567_09315 [Lachnospiraceae bacterium]|nr:hypothetical protein [Lachnospiraceae bacterium]
MNLINYKISRYEEALKTGVLTWDTNHHKYIIGGENNGEERKTESSRVAVI